MSKNDENDSIVRTHFDRKLAEVADFMHTAVSPIQVKPNLAAMGGEQFLVQTFRTPDGGHFVFLTHVANGVAEQSVLPPKVVNKIVQQIHSLSDRTRSGSAKRVAEERKAAGITPFQKKAVKS